MIKNSFEIASDGVINLLKDKELPAVKLLLEEMSEELHRDGMYFVTYQDYETLLIASKEIETIIFDLGQATNYDVIVTLINGEVAYLLNLDKNQPGNTKYDKHHITKQHLNLIKVLQVVTEPTLETNFPSIPFTIKVAGETMPAFLLSKKDLK